MTQYVNVFISHSWSYSDHYEKLAEWIFCDWNYNGEPIVFIDQSVPKDDPIHNAQNAAYLKAAIYQRILVSDVVVIPMGMYANYSHWIQKEIDGAELYLKPILAVNPWAQERKSSVVRLAAAAEVGWTQKSVGSAIWNLARGSN